MREQATDAAKRDWGVIRDWLGATDDVPLTRDQHEQFATALERYFAEGQAPSLELVPIFERFKRWMIEIYRTVESIAPEIPQGVRNVMDRMLASDEQIARARMQNHGPPPPRTFDEAPPIKTGQDEIEGLVEDLASADDYEIRLAQIEAGGRLTPEDKAALAEADVIAGKAELYAKAYEAAAACMG